MHDRGIDLAKPYDVPQAVIGLLLSEPEKLVEIAYKLAADQHPDVGPEGFADGLVGGDCLWQLSQSLTNAVIDFFPIPSVREALARLLTEYRASLSNLTDSSSSAPDSPGSNPGNSPSAS